MAAASEVDLCQVPLDNQIWNLEMISWVCCSSLQCKGLTGVKPSLSKCGNNFNQKQESLDQLAKSD